MNTSKLKAYAPKARRDFIEAVAARAALYGITDGNIEPVTEQGDVAIIGGRAFPKKDAATRKRLVELVSSEGYQHTIEAFAYTWFNRLVALRYMELHGYFEHGYRILSHPEGKPTPEILENAERVSLVDLENQKVLDLKLAGDKDEELYRLLLVSQCKTLGKVLPFLWGDLNEPSELLLPDNLLHSDSLVCELVAEIPEEDWRNVEIIGWLYQFYISEKKDEVIGSVVKSEDIPAATQLFTPNWIVKYLVQNSLGRQWMATYSNSPLKEQMEYYIEPAEQTEEVQQQLKEITPTSLNPEEMTLLDPACGSGHILVEAYDLFKTIYLERGYRLRDVPRLILEKNLFGLEIDDRAAQLASFALLMKAREDDRSVLGKTTRVNILPLQASNVDELETIVVGLVRNGANESDARELIETFRDAKTFGSLIAVSRKLVNALPSLNNALSKFELDADIFEARLIGVVKQKLSQADLLGRRYDCVVANPPYMSGRKMNSYLKKFVSEQYSVGKGDLFACFIERGEKFAKHDGQISMVTMQSWMFLSTFQEMRERLLGEKTLICMVQIGYNSFPSLNSKIAQATAFTFANYKTGDYLCSFVDLNNAPQSADKEQVFLSRTPDNEFRTTTRALSKIPGSPVAYWVDESFSRIFQKSKALDEITVARQGLVTAANELFVRLWFEVSCESVGFNLENRAAAKQSGKKWFPYNKGGEFRKWYGNNDHVVDWENDGERIKEKKRQDLEAGRITANNSKCWNQDYYFLPSVSWSGVTSKRAGFRKYPTGSIFSGAGLSAFFDENIELMAIAGLNSVLSHSLLSIISPGLSLTSGEFGKLPFLERPKETEVNALASKLIDIARSDWDAYEWSWDFRESPLLESKCRGKKLSESYTLFVSFQKKVLTEMKSLEEENNRIFVDAYDLTNQVATDLPADQITLTGNPAYRYGNKVSEQKQYTRFRLDTIQELFSYAVGCMMGRYSLDRPGLVYASSGNVHFDSSSYQTLPADEDGIVPVTDFAWFDDDATNRFVEFVSVAWPKEHLEENLRFAADTLKSKGDESPRDTIRRYFSTDFFKNHMQMYKKRPIYWLFSSGKQRAFQCLVYLHRYNEGTLARMRTEYVIPLQGKINARIEQLEDDISAATSTAHRKQLEKEQQTLKKQKEELQAFDEKLRHYADMRISLDLNDGVKVNYGKFGDLLAEVKAITGNKAA